jgi:hypothetical protein
MATLMFGFVFQSSAGAILTNTELTGAAAPTVNISTTLLADGTTIAAAVTGGALVYDSNTKSWTYRLASADLATYFYRAMATTTYATALPLSVHAFGMIVPDEKISTRLAPTTAGRTLDVAATGEAGIDLTNKLDTAGILPAAAAGGAGGLAIVGSVMGKSPATLAAADVSGNLPVDLQTIKTQAVTASAPVTVPASIGTSTYAGADTAGTTELLTRVPDATPGAVGGLPTVDAANMVAGVLALGAQAKLDVNAETDTALTDYGANKVAPPSADDVAAKILITPANKLASDVLGRVTPDTVTPAAPSTADIKLALEIDGGKLDQIWDTTENDGGLRRFTANALELVPTSGTAPTVVQIRQEMDANSTKLADILTDTSTTIPSLLAGIGSGSGTGTYTDTVTDGVNPVDGVRVVLYTDSVLTHAVYQAFTDALGIFVMHPDPGTYYRLVELAGYIGTQGVQVVVT